MTQWKRYLAVALLLFARAAGAQELRATISSDAGGREVDAQWKRSDPLPAGDPLTLALTCDPSTNCGAVTVHTLTNGQPGTAWTLAPGATPTAARFTLARAALQATAGPELLLEVDGTPFPIPLAGPTPTAGAQAATSPWTGRPFTPCDPTVVDTAGGPDHAVFLVTPTGSVVARSDPYIDEDDQITVYVQGPPEVIRQVRVQRSSDFRDFSSISIVGMDATVDPGLVRQSTGDLSCTMTSDRVENFKGGEAGEVEILLMVPKEDAKGEAEVEPQSVGKFQFPVHRLYRGAFSFGIVRTELSDPSFSVAEGDSVLLRGGGGSRFLYSLAYTPYLWGPRDVERWSITRLPQYINPTVGVVVTEVGKNALGGLSLELPTGIFLTAGLHAGKVHRPAEGLRRGNVVPASRRSAASQERWESAPFYSLTVDLRAAAKFLAALGGS